MIITKLIGGLGNQMFQYAAGLSLAEYYNTDLKLDLSYFDCNTQYNFTPRNYQLKIFNIQEEICSAYEIERFHWTKLSRLKQYTIRAQNLINPHIYFKESFFHFNPDFFSTGRNTYLDGFWQSDKYFAHVNEKILKDFTLNVPLDNLNQSLADQINSVSSASIHIRRGDYITNTEANNHHGVSSIEYYYKAIDIIKQKIKDPHFFVFSDDINWAQQNLKVLEPITFVDINRDDNCHFDLYLMSLCQNNIVANSSFSWWAAWLNTNKEKVVIAPGRWFNTDSNKTTDLIPEAWIQI